MISGRFLPEWTAIDRNSEEKSAKNFLVEYCFHVPLISGVSLSEPARTSPLGLRLQFPTTQLLNYSTMQLVNCLNYTDSTIQPLNYSTIQLFSHSTIQLFNN